jgi:hypothetical protein
MKYAVNSPLLIPVGSLLRLLQCRKARGSKFSEGHREAACDADRLRMLARSHRLLAKFRLQRMLSSLLLGMNGSSSTPSGVLCHLTCIFAFSDA